MNETTPLPQRLENPMAIITSLPTPNRHAIVSAKPQDIGAKVGLSCSGNTYRTRLTLALCALVVPLGARTAEAQALNLVSDVTLATGVRMSPGDGGGVTKRSPLIADLDFGFVLDHDETSEWGVGFTFGLEGKPEVSLCPQVRMVRGEAPLKLFVGAGLPVFVSPDTLFGVEGLVGGRYELQEGFGLTSALAIDYFFAGDDLPEGASNLRFNLGVGLHLLF